MGRQHNINTIWKVAELALRCTDKPAKRPDMTAVVTELKESFNLEMSSIGAGNVDSGDISEISGYSRNDVPAGGSFSSGNFEMAHIGGTRLPDYGPLAR